MVNAVTDMYSERVTTPMHSRPVYLTNVSGSNIHPGGKQQPTAENK